MPNSSDLSKQDQANKESCEEREERKVSPNCILTSLIVCPAKQKVKLETFPSP